MGSASSMPPCDRDGEELGVARGERRALRCEEHALAVGREALHAIDAGMPRQARGRTAGERHRVDVGVAVVLRAERNRLPVRRERRIRLDPVVGRQPADVADVGSEVGHVEIAAVDEREMRRADGGLRQQLGVGRVDAGVQP